MTNTLKRDSLKRKECYKIKFLCRQLTDVWNETISHKLHYMFVYYYCKLLLIFCINMVNAVRAANNELKNICIIFSFLL